MKRQAKLALTIVLAAVILVAAVVCAVNIQEPPAYGYSYSDSVFEIKSQKEFENFAEFTATVTGSFQYKTIRLYSDIDLSGINFKLGNFNGRFEGNGHAVRNVRESLFNYVQSSGVVSDLNIYFASSNAFVQTNAGIVENIGFFGTLNAGTGGNYFVAPINNNAGTISDCVNACDYSSSFAGNNYAGFAITNTGNIENCVFAGRFNFESGKTYNAAGISLNFNAADSVFKATGSVSNCAPSWARRRG